MTDRMIVAVVVVLAFLVLVVAGIYWTDTPDAGAAVFIIVIWSPILLFVAVIGSLAFGGSRRERRRYWDYLDKASAAGRSIDDELRAKARAYAYRRPWARENKADGD